MTIKNLKELLIEFSDSLELDYDLKKKNWFNIGGKTKIFFKADNLKQLIKFPELYYAKSHFPLEISQRAFDHLWRICESYELWCKETNQTKKLFLNLID